ncbi:mediator of DNA damage checkpoint protein 1 [Cloeon dipterum]|uniref:mediator of DNA damage checkpoint protein 1 n=1 Tax=Cloeon dipterum TaxID=197152 RepID=UPI00322084F9
MRTFTFVVVLVALAALASARPQDDGDYYEDEVPAVPSSTARAMPQRSRGLSSLRKPSAGKKVTSEPTSTTTTTTTPAPSSVEYEEEAEEEAAAAPAAEEPTTKKYLIAGRNGVVRPFRSNDELIAALKRRRTQSSVSTHAPIKKNDDESTEAPSKFTKVNKNSRNLNNKRFSPVVGHVASQPVSQSVETPAPAPKARHSSPPSFSRRGTTSRSRAQEEQLVAEDAEESQQQQQDSPPPTRPSRSFSPRRRS